MFTKTTIIRREMMAYYAIQSTCAVFLLLINSGSTTENTLGFLSERNPVIVGRNITLMLIPFYHAFVSDIHYLKLQVIFRKDSAAKEIQGAIRSFENGKAFFMEISNVNKAWNNSAVFFKLNNKESNKVDLKIKDRTEGLLHILSDPSQPGDTQIAFYPPVEFKDWKQILQWWPNRYGGTVNDENKKEIIFTIKIANHRTFFLEYVHLNSPMNISATVVSAHKGVGPTCTNQECGRCVCVHLGEDFTCSTDGNMLAMWIGSENVEFERQIGTSNEVQQYRPQNCSIAKHHHNRTIVCIMEKNGFVFNDSATLFVLDAVQSTVSPDSSTALTYTLVFTSVFIVAVAASFILVKRHKRSKDNFLGFCRAFRRAPTRARDIDQADTMSDDDDDFDSDLSANAQESGRAKFPIEESTGASVTLVYADLDIKFLEQGPHPGPTVKKYEPTQYVEFRAYKTEVTEYGNINMAD